MNVEALQAILERNLGNALTPELVLGILSGVQMAGEPDNSIDPALFAPQTYKGLIFQAESLRATLPELRPLHERHFAETEGFRETEGLNVDYSSYARQETSGSFLLFTCRDESTRELLGDAMVFIQRNRHTQKLSSYEDAFFLAPEARRGWAALKFISYVESCLVTLGVSQIAWGCKMVNDISPIYIRLGYTQSAKVFTKVFSAEVQDAQAA
jgi:hypothetical protein